METTYSPTETDVLTAWQERSAAFTSAVEAVHDWQAPSPCEGWSARDVLDHVLGTERDFLAAQALLSADAEADPGDPVALWATHQREVTALLGEASIAQRPYEGAFGPTTVGALMVEFYGFDLVVHRWDLDRSQGREARLSAHELAIIEAAVAGWGEHAYAPGILARPVPVPEGADRQARVLALTGRRD